MNEQIVLLILLIAALAVTLGLYILKARKEVQYKGDERWETIQVKAGNAANWANTVLLVLLIVLQVVVDTQATITIQRAITCALLFIGLRNLLELAATLYFDRQM